MAKSDTHVTSLVCLSMKGELYRVDKDFFFSKVQAMQGFMRKLEKQSLENVRDQVRKIAFVKQSEEKQEQANGQQTLITEPSKNATGGAMNEVPDGINLRKEAQKIDLKQFDSSDVEHVIPIISVMRPPTGFREMKGNPAGNSLTSQTIGQTKESKDAATD